jgi:acetyltransferase-like isoleucine patch superfamily enzyme
VTAAVPDRGLTERLRRLYEAEDALMRQRFDRSLPLSESISDRWERARSLGFGEGASIYHHSYVYGDVQVGHGTWIGPNTLLDGSGGLEIGDFCSISAGAQIYTHNTVRWALSGGQAEYEHAPTTIGDACFIGPCAVIAMGLSIGRRCVVGAHAYVNRDLADSSIALGVPARVVGRVVEGPRGEVVLDYSDDAL